MKSFQAQKWRKAERLMVGMATFIPGFNHVLGKLRRTGGTDSARYCYSVWLRQLVMAHNNGLPTTPKVVAELGPGDSIGIGLAALIAGAEKYFAFDVVEFAAAKRNIQIFDDLVALFKRREAIPNEDEFPRVQPKLKAYHFPRQILTKERLNAALEPSRLNRIRNSILNIHLRDSSIRYIVPWFDSYILGADSVDMIYSQAVLEHVDNLPHTYQAMHSWLKPEGFISHVIDFKCHGTAVEWNGHWTYSDFIWKLIKGRRTYLLNREPHSTHIRLIKEVGFKILCDEIVYSKSEVRKEDLAIRFRSLDKEDLLTSGAFIQAIK
ncbi:MAG TPA: methyltransferase domain-containing protein [Nitrospirales bacterium]|nr:hypothetical protein [Nitrospiraceae bacterium]HNP28699.1 methyltransferase domain-containing protein [Nitrospirales bacterium]